MRWSDRKAQLYAEAVARASDQQLARIMRSPLRRLLLRQIFSTMCRRLDARRAVGVDAVLEFRITGGRRGDDCYQVRIADGAAQARRGSGAAADVLITCSPVAFLRLTSGSSGWLELFLRRRLRIDGSKLLAVRFPGIFRIPRAAEPRTDRDP